MASPAGTLRKMTWACARQKGADFATHVHSVKTVGKVLTFATSTDKYSADLASGLGM
jgi:hypothetical protein